MDDLFENVAVAFNVILAVAIYGGAAFLFFKALMACYY